MAEGTGSEREHRETPVALAFPEVFPPTLREVLLRPWWIGMLAVALLVAAVCAWLGQWQLGRAIDAVPHKVGSTEVVRPIADIVQPGAYLPEPLVGQKVAVDGSFVAGDFLVFSSRYNKGDEGYWVVGQFRTDAASPTSLAVAVGWTDREAQARRAASALNAAPPQKLTVTGRLIADEGPAVPPAGGSPWAQTQVSPPALLSRWHDVPHDLDIYRPYLVSAREFGGLTTIYAAPPDDGSGVNWLNIFYAAEWVVFAGFAIYMWYRSGKDSWQKEIEALTGGEDDEDEPGPL